MYDTSLALYPNNTRIKIAELWVSDNIDEADRLADDIIESNAYVAAAYNIKAEIAYRDGDFEKVVFYKLEEIKVSKYNIEAYRELEEKMKIGIKLYQQVGAEESVLYCKQILDSLPILLSTRPPST